MKVSEYRDAVECFEPDICLKHRIAERIRRKGRKAGPRRTLTGVLVAAAVLVCTMGIAMAASPELRHAVIALFRIGTAEQVPGPEAMAGETSEEPVVIGSDIGGQVKAQYIRWGEAYRGRAALEEDGDGHILHVWDVEDGVLSEQRIGAEECAFSLTWRGMDYEGLIYWGVTDGELFYSGNSYDRELGTEWYVSPVTGRTDVVLLHVSQGSQIEYESYELLCHLDTGELEDLLAGTGVEDLEYAYDYLWTDDLSGLLVTCRDEAGGARTYYCGVTAGTLAELGELTGTGGAYAFFAGGETLIVSSFTDTACSCWSYDLRTGQALQVLEQANIYREHDEEPYGIMFFGSRYGVYTERSGRISVIDFKTGARTAVEGFILSGGSSFQRNPAGTKLLYTVYDSGADGLGISELGVLDLEKGVFITFDREGYDAMYEYAVGWFDDDRAAIWAWSQEHETQYLYLYEF